MNCPTCNQEIPVSEKTKAPLLACPRCMKANSYQSILNFQAQFISRIMTGEAQVTLRKPAFTPRWHVAFIQYPKQAWCGVEIPKGWKNVRRASWPGIDHNIVPVCNRCQEVIQQLAEEEASREVA